jgi:nitrogen fixation NifU-like protein
MSRYPQFLVDHFQNPRNVGEIPDPDGLGTVGNASCGDIMQMAIRVKDGRIAEAKFKTFGCGAAIATSSIMTERIQGATPEDALKIAEQTTREILDQLPKDKLHCFSLAAEALKLAVEEYRCKEAGLPQKGGFNPLEEEESDALS